VIVTGAGGRLAFGFPPDRGLAVARTGHLDDELAGGEHMLVIDLVDVSVWGQATGRGGAAVRFRRWWQVLGSNQRIRLSRRFYREPARI
jgi:hypothetical protein